MQSALNTSHKTNPIELAILAKWTLQQAWDCCLQVFQQRLKQQADTGSQNDKLHQMYSDFFYQAFYSPIHTITDINNLLKNLRRMLLLLKHLDYQAWASFMIENDLNR